MSYFDLGIAEALMELRQRDAQRQAEQSHLAYTAGAARMKQLPRPRFRLVNQMGRTLSALGQRLEQYGLPQASSH